MTMYKLAALALIASASATPAQTPSALIIDRRPTGEDRSRNLSASVFSCSYGIRVLSDEGRPRKRLDALGVALRASSLARRLEQRPVVIRSYQVFFNSAAAQMNQALTIGVGSVNGGAGPIGRSAAKPKCGRDKTPDGWFDPSETNNGNPPIIVEIEAEVAGKPLSVRSVHSPAEALRVPATAFSSKAKKNFAEGEAALEVDRAIDRANARFVAKATTLI
jgi:hypothetical protein